MHIHPRPRFTLAVIAATALCALLVACGDTPAPIVLSDTCSIDTPPGGSVVSRGSQLHVGGWAFDQVLGNSPASVRIQFVSADRRNVAVFEAARGTRRPDVAKALDSPGAEESGFDAVVDTASLEPGRYTIYVLQKTRDRTLICARDYHLALQ